MCIECGSNSYLKSNDKAVQFRGYLGVDLYCTNEEHSAKVPALAETFALTFDQANAIRLRVPPSGAPM